MANKGKDNEITRAKARINLKKIVVYIENKNKVEMVQKKGELHKVNSAVDNSSFAPKSQ